MFFFFFFSYFEYIAVRLRACSIEAFICYTLRFYTPNSRYECARVVSSSIFESVNLCSLSACSWNERRHFKKIKQMNSRENLY